MYSVAATYWYSRYMYVGSYFAYTYKERMVMYIQYLL